VLGFALALHAPAVAGGYVLDDGPAILGHPAVTGEVPWWETFTREYWGRPLAAGWSSSYRPLTSLSFALEHRITEHPALHHAVNVLAFALLCALVTRCARAFGAGRATLVVGLVFAALPIHVEGVASLVGRADVFAALAGLAAFAVAHARPGRGASAAVAGLYAIGLLCKESVALLPAVFAWHGLLAWRDGDPLGRAFGPAVATGCVGLAYLAARQALLPVDLPADFVGADNQLVELEGLARAWGNLAVMGHYVEIAAVPLRLCADHTYADVVPPTGPEDSRGWLGLAVVALVIRDGRRALLRRGPGLGVTALLAYLVIGHWMVDVSVILAERLAVWPSVFVALALGPPVAAALESRRIRPRVAVSSAVALVGLLSARTIDRTLDWRDSASLYQSSADACPAALHNRVNLAHALARAGRSDEAVWELGIAAAGRATYPHPFRPLAFEAERALPLAERLPRLPELCGVPDPPRFWAGLHDFLVADGWHAEAAVVRELAGR
jgi:hypothetical protein